MKKKLSIVLGILAITFIVAFNVNIKYNTDNLSELSLANVEILALAAELPEYVITCGQYEGPCWEHDFNYPWTPCRWNGHPFFSCKR